MSEIKCPICGSRDIDTITKSLNVYEIGEWEEIITHFTCKKCGCRWIIRETKIIKTEILEDILEE